MLDKEMIDWIRNVELALRVPEKASGVLLAVSVVVEEDIHLSYKIPPMEFAEYITRIWTVADKKAVREYIEEAVK